ncbi:MAG: type III-B CRISPR module RAMP protein Cmr4 [Acidobacteria bacterium]|jgi:CRISPR-associated protein Cmr4|nr:MAG: type III-B CRISPR module RAMP protein Cmr4 [Acidobacteriota bacterium]GIU81026.1 MAG: type III-B CRISPR module RAMP protein Cmr4 [Pyrinomonadaceae bacterium]
MFDKAAILFLYTETPLHAGSGTSLGIVDLPIQRERTTGYPIVQASGLKGCLRDVANSADRAKVEIVFGPEQDPSAHAGALSVGDARILLFPVRSLVGVFAWVTSRNVLARFQRDAQLAGLRVDWPDVGPSADSAALIANNSMVVADGKVVLEEFAFEARANDAVRHIADWLARNALPSGDEYAYWRETLPKRLVILPETAFQDFVQFSTEVISRVRIDDEKKTVARGALWTEEHLPTDTLLYATLFASKPRTNSAPPDLQDAQAVLNFVKNCVDGRRLQLGGDSTVGRGFVKTRMVP